MPGPNPSPSGAPYLRASVAKRADTRDELKAHLEKHFGKPDLELEDVHPELVHIDVHVISPATRRDAWTVFTTGMSDLPMRVPRGDEAFRYAELILKLPRSWPLEKLAEPSTPDDVERWYWPIRWLKQLARHPHRYETWIGPGHTFANEDPPQPLAEGTKLCAFTFRPPRSVPPEARTARLSGERAVNLYVLHALHLDELNLKLNRGSNALLEALDKAEVPEVLDPTRRSTVRRKLFGIF